MTDFSALLQPDRGQPARTIHVVHPDRWESWLAAQTPRTRTAALAHKEGRGGDEGPGYGGPPAGRSAAQSHEEDPVEELDLFSLDPALDVPPQTAEEQVIAAERALLTDEVRTDPAALAELLHPEWAEIGASGRLMDRATTLNRLGPLGDLGVEVVDVQRVSDDLILLLWRTSDDGGSVLRSSLWQRDGGRWRQRFHQGTPEGGPA